MQKKNQKPVKVKFLIDRDYTEDTEYVFAYFPYINEGQDKKRCYSHVGQHSTCITQYAKECKYATKHQYADLKAELESLGYVLDIIPAPKLKLKKTDTVIISGRRWFDKISGQTYHSTSVFVNSLFIDRVDYKYGYGEQYIITGRKILEQFYHLPIESIYDLGSKKVCHFLTICSEVASKKHL